MHEAVEIAKLRLFLKLVSLVDDERQIEPLPDIDFNIRAGNTLVGFATRAEMQDAVRGDRLLLLPEDEELLASIDEQAADVDRLFTRFRQMQTEYDPNEYGDDYAIAKQTLRQRLEQLAGQLDRLLAQQYGVKPDTLAFAQWCESHQPFHWFAEFYGIVEGGGFDVIIGNPPYVEYKDVVKSYSLLGYMTFSCQNLFAFVMERTSQLSRRGSQVGMIVPLSAFSTDRMIPLIQHTKVTSTLLHIANFSWRPGKLFEGVNLQLSIALQKIGRVETPSIITSNYILWDSEVRPQLFETKIQYTVVDDNRLPGSIPKLGHEYARSILMKLRMKKTEVTGCVIRGSGNRIYYRRGGLYWKVFVDFETGSSEEKVLSLILSVDKYSLLAALSSNLWFWYLQATSDCRHLGNRDIYTFPFDPRSLSAKLSVSLQELGQAYVIDLRRNAVDGIRVYKGTKQVPVLSFRVKESKAIIDKIDKLLADYYDFTDEELDFIINYDIKYRMGDALGEDSEDVAAA